MLDTAGGLKGWMERVENLPGVCFYFCLAFSRNVPLNIEADVCDRIELFFFRWVSFLLLF